MQSYETPRTKGVIMLKDILLPLIMIQLSKYGNFLKVETTIYRNLLKKGKLLKMERHEFENELWFPLFSSRCEEGEILSHFYFWSVSISVLANKVQIFWPFSKGFSWSLSYSDPLVPELMPLLWSPLLEPSLLIPLDMTSVMNLCYENLLNDTMEMFWEEPIWKDVYKWC